jgi:cytochrome b561
MLKNTKETYGSLAKALHWLMAILLVCLLTVGFWLQDLGMPILYKVHKTLGFMILLLVIIRMIWKLMNVTPSYDDKLPKLMAFAGHAMHYALYALMFLTPLSAFIASNAAHRPVSFLFLFDLPLLFTDKNIELASKIMELHSVFAASLSWAIAAHVLAAFYHHFIRKDSILIRMLPNLLSSGRIKH